MEYRITVKCCDKTYTIEATVYDPKIDLDYTSLDNVISGGIEYWKEKDGLGDFPHEIIKSEMSIDGKD
ncbi:hypothetical protein [Dysgonomonas sp. 511]|uniref:hypothetical protein n=1 Tax=Dysgonomonas sp. 511 TaxID=2302930 RepID=UPI0013D74D6F|nr:hypothetical protein [Dysgonomonas sp. 511]